jgi:hypothetical protein
MKSEKQEALRILMKNMSILEYITYINVVVHIIDGMVHGAKSRHFRFILNPEHMDKMVRIFSLKGYEISSCGDNNTVIISWG